MVVYRIIREKFKHDLLSAEGSRLYGGRWNPKGVAVLYTTSSAALALVEVLAHAPNVRYEDLPRYWIAKIEIPDNIRVYQEAEMPSYWQDPIYDQTQQWLGEWLQQPDTLAVAVPSVVVPYSQNIILHTRHPSFQQIKILDQQALYVDRRLWQR